MWLIQLVHIAHGMRAAAVLGNTGVVAQARGAVVPGARGDLCKAIAHQNSSLNARQRAVAAIVRYMVQANVGAGNSPQKSWT